MSFDLVQDKITDLLSEDEDQQFIFLTGALVLPIAAIFFKISSSSYKKAYEELPR